MFNGDVIDSIGTEARAPILIAYMGFMGVSLLWLLSRAAGEAEDPESFYVADRSLSSVFNGFALAGENISVLTLLGVSGNIAFFGYDGYTYAVDSMLALGVLLFLAQRIHANGRYTLGDLFASRSPGVSSHLAGSLTTLSVTVPLLMIQLHVAGASTAYLLGLTSTGPQIVCTIAMGAFVTCVACLGGLKGTSLMHILKLAFVVVALAVISVLSLSHYSWDFGTLLSTAMEKSTAPENYLEPGFGQHSVDFGPLNTLSNHVVLVLGSALMPQLILRVTATRDGHAARRSVAVAATLTGCFTVLLVTVSFAAAAVAGGEKVGAADFGPSALITLAAGITSGNSSFSVGIVTALACAVFLAVLTTIASMTFATAVSVVRDVYARGEEDGVRAGEVRLVRLASAAVAIVGIALTVATHHLPLRFLASFSLCVAASCVFPALVYSFFWRGFNRRGLLWSVYGGLGLCVLLTVFSPTVSGAPVALLPDMDFDWYPLQSPGLVSISGAFLLGWLGSVTAPRRAASHSRRPGIRV
ncbi:transporter [Streptomyces sp. MNU77]|nr:transporter [Streptomyces sp. MNU77]